MNTTQDKPAHTLRRYRMEAIPGAANGSSAEWVHVYARTEAKAYRDVSGGAEAWKITGFEDLPYKHAERAAAVAAALGAGWAIEPMSDEHPDCAFRLISPEGARFYFSPPNYDHKGAFRVGYSGPRSLDGSYLYAYDSAGNRLSDPAINLSENKTPEQMAKDITRRLLPQAAKVHAIKLARLENERQAADSRLAALRELCAAFGIAIPLDHSGRPRFVLYHSRGEFELDSSGDVRAKLTIPRSDIPALGVFINRRAQA